MIISGGENVYSAEVELALMELDEIAAVAVIARPDEKWGEVPHAVIVLVPRRLLRRSASAAPSGRAARALQDPEDLRDSR